MSLTVDGKWPTGAQCYKAMLSHMSFFHVSNLLSDRRAQPHHKKRFPFSNIVPFQDVSFVVFDKFELLNSQVCATMPTCLRCGEKTVYEFRWKFNNRLSSFERISDFTKLPS